MKKKLNFNSTFLFDLLTRRYIVVDEKNEQTNCGYNPATLFFTTNKCELPTPKLSPIGAGTLYVFFCQPALFEFLCNIRGPDPNSFSSQNHRDSRRQPINQCKSFANSLKSVFFNKFKAIVL